MSSSSQSSQYLHQLTWLRGFAAFVVVVSHTIRATEVAYTPDEEAHVFPLASAFDMGTFGVILFFMLSGATLYLSSKGNLPSVSSFYIKRFFRIWPAFIVSMLAYMAFSVVFKSFYPDVQGHWIENQFLAEYTWTDILAYVTLTFNFFGTEGLFNNAFWSLPVEFQYYLLFPALLILLNRIGVAGPLLVGGLMLAIYQFTSFPENPSTILRLGYSFCGGVAIAYIYSNTTIRMPAFLGVTVLVLAYTFISLMHSGYIARPDFPFIRHIWNWHILFGFICMAACMFSKLTLPTKVANFLQLYGAISYSTYLYHNLVIGLLVLVLIHFDINDGALRYVLMLVGTLLITHVLAMLSYKLVELPTITLGRRFSKPR